MNIKNVEIISVISIVFLTLMVGTAFMTAPYIGSAYLMMMKPVGDQFPVLTSKISLPMLRAANLDSCSIPNTPVWAGLLWLLLFSAPWGIFAWARKAQESDVFITRLASGMSLYLPLSGIIFVTVLAGLAVSMACM